MCTILATLDSCHPGANGVSFQDIFSVFKIFRFAGTGTSLVYQSTVYLMVHMQNSDVKFYIMFIDIWIVDIIGLIRGYAHEEVVPGNREQS